jgi:hypothetical protein
MSKRAHLSFGLVGSIAIGLWVLAGSGCGDDDKPSGGSGGKGGDNSAAGSSAAGSSGKAGGSAGSTAGAAGAATGMGSLEEGDQCMTTAECGSGLTCTVQAVSRTPVRVCARPCTTGSNTCESESCASPFTQQAKDTICVNTEPQPFALCGAGVTAICGGDRVCLYFQNSTVGVCVDLCALDPTKDAGLDDLPLMCPIAAQSCIGGIVDDGGANVVGLCGLEVDRDGECGLETGKLCKGTDICVPDDTKVDASPQHCREDCSKAGMCTSGGACTAYQDITYCKK